VAGSVVYVAATGEGKTCLGQGASLDHPVGWEDGKTQAQVSSGSTEELWNAAGTAGHFGLVGVSAYRLNMVVAAGAPEPMPVIGAPGHPCPAQAAILTTRSPSAKVHRARYTETVSAAT
jgi:hypothetical protein